MCFRDEEPAKPISARYRTLPTVAIDDGCFQSFGCACSFARGTSHGDAADGCGLVSESVGGHEEIAHLNGSNERDSRPRTISDDDAESE
jgi:hypothetical protein